MKERFDVNDVDDKNILFRFEPEIILDSVFFGWRATDENDYFVKMYFI